MEHCNEISSSGHEFDLTLLNKEATSIHRELDDKTEQSNDDDSEEVTEVIRRKIRIINNDSDIAEVPQSDSSEWINCIEVEEIS